MTEVKNKKDYIIWGVLILAILFVFYLSQSSFLDQYLGKKDKVNFTVPDQVVVKHPNTNVSVILIRVSDCEMCHGDTIALERLKNLSTQYYLNVAQEVVLDSKSGEAQKYITKYNMTKLPAIIISKEASISKDFINAWTKAGNTFESDGFFILRKPAPPYMEMNILKGYVQGVQIINPECVECGNYAELHKSLVLRDIIPSVAIYNYTSEKGQEYIKKYGITKLPALILNKSGEQNGITFYDFLNEYKDYIDETDDAYVFDKKLPPPFFSLKQNTTKDGLVGAILLHDKYCKDCYDPGLLVKFLVTDPINLFVIDEQPFDVNDQQGFEFVRKDNITSFPTVILSGEALDYPKISEKWNQLGTIEKDGNLLFRNMSQVKDINYTKIDTPRLVDFSVNTTVPLDILIEKRTVRGATISFKALTPQNFTLKIISRDNVTITKSIENAQTVAIAYKNGEFDIR